MDLSLSADFESEILKCWDENDNGGTQSELEQGGNGGAASRPLDQKQSTPTTKEAISRLPSFPTAIGGTSASTEQQPTPSNDVTSAQLAANLASMYGNMQPLVPLTPGTVNPSQVGFSQPNMMMQYALNGQAAAALSPSFPNTSQHATLSTTTGSVPAVKTAAAPSSTIPIQQTGQASADRGTTATTTTTQLHPLGMLSSSVCPPMTSTPVANNALQFNPYMFNPYTMFANNPELLAAFQATQQQMAAQFAAAQASVAQATVAQARVPQAKPLVPAPPATVLPPAPPAVAAPVKPPPVKPPPAPPKPAKKKSPPKTSKSRTTSSKKSASSGAPPFLLFDAPCELRTNFINNQRRLNLPVHKDSNSYHYGMAVNGFHPQLNVDPSVSSLPPPSDVKLIDARHEMKRGGKERNEREQKRAQKITELIEQIRVSMEDGGWKVEMKSKYHTLSTCGEYVKHLVKTTKEKEEAVEKARSDLEVKERKLEEDKAVLEGRSDPESVTSSLTASSVGSMGRRGAQGSSQPNEDGEKKRKASPESSNDASSKKAKTSEGTEDSSGGDDGGSGPQGHNISLGKMSSSVSDITDSNRGSSDSGGEKASGSDRQKRPLDDGDESELPSSSSISSTAAVIRGAGSQHREHGHADVVIKKSHSRSRKRMRLERSSLDRKFDLDYEEVFHTSNVPQLISTPSGRIVAWNKFFLRATGLDKNDVQRLTIFSMVKPDKLANLFEMVAVALRQSSASGSDRGSASSGCTTNESDPNSSNASSSLSSRSTEYATMTLPCTKFPAYSGGDKERSPLYMTVTLMPDEDVRKRCFHCVLTDCRGTDGRLGFVSAELLAKMFIHHKQPPSQESETKRASAVEDAKPKESEAGMEIEIDSSAAVADDEGDNEE